MKRPSQMMTFDTLYGLAARDGRGEALFGNTIELARPAFERTLIGNECPKVYVEFPLVGDPCFDILSVYPSVEPGAQFASGAGFGYQPMMDWFSHLKGEGALPSCGIEVDCSTGEAERAGVYLQQRSCHEYVVPFLESVNESERAASYLDVLDRLPGGWPGAYVGLFPGREGAPMRIGGYPTREGHRACADDPAELGRLFDAVGYTAYDRQMLERCSVFMRLAPSIDFQFDIMPDGTLGDTFGLSLSFNETKPRVARECMESGYGARLMERLESWGLADDRWHLIAGAPFARLVPFEREDGSEGRFALCVLLNYAKVKFTGGEATHSKFYFKLVGTEVEV